MNLSLIAFAFAGGFWAIVYWFESMFRFFFPKGRKSVEGEIVLITGAGSGLGQKLSLVFAKLGCVVVGWDISQKGLDETAKRIQELDLASQWYSYTCDISDRQKVYDTAKKVAIEVGNVGILINNAGIVTGKNLLDCSDEQIKRTIDVNVMAHFWTIKAFLPSMIEKDKGHIVTIASAGGLFGVPGIVDYCSSKYAVIGMAESLNAEMNNLKKFGVKSTIVCPYYIDTGMFEGVSSPLVPLIKLDDATDQIVDAVLRDKVWLMMPRTIYILYGLRGLIPTKSVFVAAKALGMSDGMKTFIGRRKND